MDFLFPLFSIHERSRTRKEIRVIVCLIKFRSKSYKRKREALLIGNTRINYAKGGKQTQDKLKQTGNETKS